MTARIRKLEESLSPCLLMVLRFGTVCVARGREYETLKAVEADYPTAPILVVDLDPEARFV